MAGHALLFILCRTTRPAAVDLARSPLLWIILNPDAAPCSLASNSFFLLEGRFNVFGFPPPVTWQPGTLRSQPCCFEPLLHRYLLGFSPEGSCTHSHGALLPDGVGCAPFARLWQAAQNLDPVYLFSAWPRNETTSRHTTMLLSVRKFA